MNQNYPSLTEQVLNPEILKNKFFNGINGPNLNLPAVYGLFKREDSGAFKIGRKWFWSTHLFIQWWESQSGKK